MKAENMLLEFMLFFIILISGCNIESIDNAITENHDLVSIYCEENEIYLNKTGRCYNHNDKIYDYESRRVTLICSSPCPLDEYEFLTESAKVRDSYSFIYNIVGTEPKIETEIRLNTDNVCANERVFIERVTESGQKIVVLCLPIAEDGSGIPKELIMHELIHSFLWSKLDCITIEEGIAKYITEFINPEEVTYGSVGLYNSYKEGFISMEEILQDEHIKGFFFFMELDEKESFQIDSLNSLFKKLENTYGADCEVTRRYIAEIKNPTIVEELTMKYHIYNAWN